MFTSNAPKLSMKVVINKKKSRVLFAEAGSDVVDVLLSFLTLPLGQIVGILESRYGGRAPDFGSLTTLYSGLSNLDSTHFSVGGAKQMLLHPTSSFQLDCRGLKFDISDNQPRKVYYCEDRRCPNPDVSVYCDVAKCVCGKPLNRGESVKEKPVSDAGVFVKKAASYVVCDDLRIVPVVADFLQTLNDLGINDTDGAEMAILSLDIEDVVELFMYSIFCSNPLTNLVNKRTQKTPPTVARRHRVNVSHPIRNGDANARNMTLKVYLQKSTNKFLLAVATDEFVELLFSFLVVPLGGVEHLLGGKTCLKNVDNLYSSLTDLIDDKYFMTPNARSSLINPKLPNGYTSKRQMLPLVAENAPKIVLSGKPLSFKAREGEGRFVKKQTMYVVRENLIVTPFSMTSSISMLHNLGISLSDVTERDFNIGIEEALRILKASLSSKTPLTDALVKPMLNELPKEPKLEQPKLES